MVPHAVLDELKREGFITDSTVIESLHGGDINDVFLVDDLTHRIVLKINDAFAFPNMLSCEVNALCFLGEHSALRYPKVLSHGIAADKQYLLLEYLEKGISCPNKSFEFGRNLARQHRITSDFFGWTGTNYIGRLIQNNDPSANWGDFFITSRIIPQVQLAISRGYLDSKWLKDIEINRQRIVNVFPEESPALLHGDLWGGNYFFGKNEAVVYDPAAYFGHREMELAMTKLFGGFDAQFYEGYNSEYPLSDDWLSRLAITQLYPNLVHLNLFGSAYKPLVLDGLAKLLVT